MKRIEIKQPVGSGAGTYELPCPKCGTMVAFPTHRLGDFTDKNGQEWWYGDCKQCGAGYKVGPTVLHLTFSLTNGALI